MKGASFLFASGPKWFGVRSDRAFVCFWCGGGMCSIESKILMWWCLKDTSANHISEVNP